MGAKKYSPSDKAAIIMAALGEELAPEVFARVGKEDGAKIARSLKNLGSIEQTEVEGVLREFLDLLNSPKARNVDPRAFIAGLKGKGGAKAQTLLDSIGLGDYEMRVFHKTRPEILYSVIRSDAPQTLALIFSHAPSPFAADLIKLFPESERLEILLRMARLQEVDPELIQDLDEHLIRETERLGASQSQKIGGIKRVAEILNALNQDAAPLLYKLQDRSPELAKDIQEEMFTFEDLLKIDERGIQEIVKTVRRETLILALRGSSVSLIQKFAAGMSERSAKMFREDLEAMGAQKKSDVMAARVDLLNATRTLIENGKISYGVTGGYI